MSSFIFLLGVLCLTAVCGAKFCNKVVTANTGLAPLIGNIQERRTAWPRALNSLDADFVCLQEVWDEKDVTNIVESVRGKYKYSVSPLHSRTLFVNRGLNQVPVSSDRLNVDEDTLRAIAVALGQDVDAWLNLWRGEGPCKNQKTVEYIVCASSCVSSSNPQTCVLQTCSGPLFGLEQECLTCMIVFTVTVLETLVTCLNRGVRTQRTNVEGLLVLSKKPIWFSRVERYFPGIKQMLPRGYIDVWGPQIGFVSCTHLQSDLLPVYAEGALAAALGISSYVEQNRKETQLFIDAHKKVGCPHILLGDFNSGPAIQDRGIEGEFPDNYQLLVDAGYRNDFVESGKAVCSICPATNPLLNVTKDTLIDHCLVYGYNSKDSQLILERFEGKFISDHSAIQATVCRKPLWR